MMLTGSHIIKMVREGRIHISPFTEENVNPNSVNLTLSDEIVVYDKTCIFDQKEGLRVGKSDKRVIHPKVGMTLEPGFMYLASTVEECGSDEFVACLEGRSSLARMGLAVHLTAGFGDLGFKSRWTMEITTQFPFVIYPFTKICQAVFYATMGERDIIYKGKYKDQSNGATETRIQQEFKHGT